MNCSSTYQDLVLCEKMGFDFIELRIDMLKKYLNEYSVKDLKSFFKNSYIQPHAFNAIYIYPEFLSEKDNIVRQAELLSDFMLCCKVGKKIGSNHIIVVPFLKDGLPNDFYEGSWDETYRESVRILKKLAKIAKNYDMNLCFEVVGLNKSSVKSIEEAKEIIEAVNLENVGYVFDIYNLYLHTKSNDYSAMKLVESEKIFAVHVNNADEVEPEFMGQDKRRFVDQGCLDLKAFYDVLNEINYDSIISIETFRPEYWDKTAQWVIKEAYKTTKKSLKDFKEEI